GERGSQVWAVCLGRALPVGADRVPAVAEALDIRVAILRDDSGDALGVVDREPEACRRAVIKNIHCESIEPDDFCKAFVQTSYVVECVTEFLSRRHVGLAEAGKVRRNDMKSVGEERN